MRLLKARSGQFLPISAMVLFTTVVFLVAVVDVYRVSRAKLKVQNLADAAALNLAAQEARAMNVVADRNEWLNHMVDDAVEQKLQGNPNIIPAKLSDVENTYKGSSASAAHNSGYVFDSNNGAIAYAAVVHTINQAQGLFADAYNNFLGASSNAGQPGQMSGPQNLIETLQADIPDLFSAGTHLFVWNSAGNEVGVNNLNVHDPASLENAYKMQPLKFVIHDVQVRMNKNNIFKQQQFDPKPTTLGKLANVSGGVGWMEPDEKQMPQIALTSGANADHVGVGVIVTQTVPVIGLSNTTVAAQAKAYVVNGSGASGDTTAQNSYGNQGPDFRPTYWIKLAKP